MNKLLLSLTGTLMLASQLAAAECVAPTNTPIIPDGHVASKDELIAAQNAVKAFQNRNLDFLVCIDEQRAALDPEAPETVSELAGYKTMEADAIALEERVAAEFNTARKAFMERQ